MRGAVSATRVRRSTPLRLLMIALIFAGFGLWQGLGCDDGVALALPVIPAHATSAATHHAAVDTADQLPSHDGDHDGGLVGACLTVLVAVAAALLILRGPNAWVLAVIRSMAGVWPAAAVRTCTPNLAQLCILRA